MRYHLLPLLIVLGACTSSVEPRSADRWSADFTATRHVMFLTWTTVDGRVSGTGTLTASLVPGSTEQLTVVGTRHADTLDFLLVRTDNEALHFRGWYTGKGASITGVLSGGQFDDLRVSFRKY